jgi:hypothetical protein
VAWWRPVDTFGGVTRQSRQRTRAVRRLAQERDGVLDELKRGRIVRFEAVDRLAALSAQVGPERWTVHADVERPHLVRTGADGRVQIQAAPPARWRSAGPAVLLAALGAVALWSWIASLQDPGRVEPPVGSVVTTDAP